MTEYSNPTEIDYFLKALVDTVRLRIIASLIQEDKSVETLAGELTIKQTKLMKHLALLEKANLVSNIEIEGDLVYTFQQKHLESIARKVFSSPQNKLDLSSFELDQDQKKIIYSYVDPDGTLKMIPTQKKKIIAICQYLIAAFKYQVDYLEKEVNEILARYYPDPTTLRRYLVENNFLARESDGSKYWRLERIN